MKTRYWFVIPLAALYLALTENLALNNIVVALLLAVFVVWLTQPPAIRIDWRLLPTAVVGLVQYIVILLIDLLRSGLQVARLVLTSRHPIVHQGIIEVQSLPHAEIATALSIHAITLTPGELVLESDEEGVMYTHSLEAKASAKHAAEMEAKRQALLQKMNIIHRD